MANPLIQIGDEVREMTAAEAAEYQKLKSDQAAAETARIAEEAAFIKDRADGLAKLEAIMTPSQARAVARKDK